MDFSAIADIINKNPVIALALVVAFCAWVIASMGRSGQANFSNVLAFAGTQTTALNQAALQLATLERHNGELTVERNRLKDDNTSLKTRLEALEVQVKQLKVQVEQVEFLDDRIKELQQQHDALQRELDAEKRKNVELQAKLNTVQAELDALRGVPEPHQSTITEHGDEIL